MLRTYAPHVMCVQYGGGCAVRWRMFSTLGGYHDCRGEASRSTVADVQYSGGIPWVRWRIFSTLGGYHDACGGIPRLLWGGIMSAVADIQYGGGIFLSTVGDVQYGGGVIWSNPLNYRKSETGARFICSSSVQSSKLFQLLGRLFSRMGCKDFVYLDFLDSDSFLRINSVPALSWTSLSTKFPVFIEYKWKKK